MGKDDEASREQRLRKILGGDRLTDRMRWTELPSGPALWLDVTSEEAAAPETLFPPYGDEDVQEMLEDVLVRLERVASAFRH